MQKKRNDDVAKISSSNVTCEAFLKRFWHPILPVKELKASPLEVSFIGDLLVLWRDSSGKVNAHENRCLHKSAKLSNGWLSSAGNLTCPYHGWEYDSGGHCINIPQSVNNVKFANLSCLKQYLCIEHVGYIWVAEDSPLSTIPPFPEHDDNSYRFFKQWPDEVWSTSPVRIIENDLDSAHIAFVHRNSFGINDEPEPALFDSLHETDYGFTGDRLMRVKNAGLGPKVTGVNAPYTTRHSVTSWYLPYTIKIDINYPESGVKHVIYKTAVPIGGDKCILVRWLFRNEKSYQCSIEDLVTFERTIVDEDKTIIESTIPTDCVGRITAFENNMPSDKPGNIMRRRLNKSYHQFIIS